MTDCIQITAICTIIMDFDNQPVNFKMNELYL